MSAELAERLFQRVNAALRSGRADDRLWIGLGLEDVPGKPFGWAFERERAAIRAHIFRKLGDGRSMRAAERFWNTHRGRGVEFAVSRMQDRLHRSHPSYHDRQAAWKARQPGWSRIAETFTTEELTMIAERFAGANDPVGQAILAKATRA